jgi:hypothetical protein
VQDEPRCVPQNGWCLFVWIASVLVQRRWQAFDSKGLPNCLFGYALLAFAIA